MDAPFPDEKSVLGLLVLGLAGIAWYFARRLDARVEVIEASRTTDVLPRLLALETMIREHEGRHGRTDMQTAQHYTQLDARFDKVDTQMAAQYAKLEARLDRIDSQLITQYAQIEARLDNLVTHTRREGTEHD